MEDEQRYNDEQGYSLTRERNATAGAPDDKRGILLATLFILAIIFAGVSLAIRPKGQGAGAGTIKGEKKKSFLALEGDGIAVIHLDGILSLERTDSPFSYTPMPSMVDVIVKRFDEYASRDNVKAIVLSVNSPGGTVVASQELYQRLKTIKDKTGVKVVASFKEVAASGGYYVAMIADSIVANDGALTGSIGVIISTLNVKGLFDRFGIKGYNFTSGKHKDMLSSYKEISQEEIDYMNDLVFTVYEEFRDLVLTNRGKKLRGNTETILDGRIFSGRQAKDAGLVDIVGTEADAVREACRLADLDPEDPYIITDDEDPFSRYFDFLFEEVFHIGKALGGKKRGIEEFLAAQKAGIPMYLYVQEGLTR